MYISCKILLRYQSPLKFIAVFRNLRLNSRSEVFKLISNSRKSILLEKDVSPLMDDLKISDDYVYTQCEKVVEALVFQIESIAEQMVSKCIDFDPDQTKKYLRAIRNEGKVDLRKTVETRVMNYRE